MNTYIEIDKLKLFARIGVAEHERVVGNLFELSIKIAYPLLDAMTNDSLDSTINYAFLCEIARNEINKPCLLIENAAYRIKQSITQQFPEITGGSLKLTKITPPISEQLSGASVIIEW
ncbi:MAG: dihydroneopterin aldolase [Muribaculaceae bacterium]|nr:dihydroneopterin aldolase [Muribaculaceae bacterium]